MSERKGCVAVSYGGKGYGIGAPWILTWLPKGYGPTAKDRTVCYIVDPPQGWTKSYGLDDEQQAPLIKVIREAIEKFMAEHPDHEIGIHE